MLKYAAVGREAEMWPEVGEDEFLRSNFCYSKCFPYGKDGEAVEGIEEGAANEEVGVEEGAVKTD